MWLFKNKKTPTEKKELPSGNFLVMNAGQPAWSEREFEPLAREAYQQNAIAYACIHRIATACADIKLDLCTGNGDDLEKITDHPLIDVLYKPNPMQSGAEFTEAMISFRLIGGNAFCVRAPLSGIQGSTSEPSELWVLRPDSVRVVASTTGVPLSYMVGMTGQTENYPVNQVDGKSDIMHIKSFNPLSTWYGQAGIESAAHSVDIFNTAQKWNYSLLKNGARPSGALEIRNKQGESQELTEEQYNRTQEQLTEQFTGSDNSGKPLLLEGGLTWVDMMLSPRDMDFQQNQLQAAKWIAAAFGVPEQMVGINENSTHNNMAEAKLNFYRETVLPLMEQYVKSLNNWLVPQFGEGMYLKIDADSIPALEPVREAKFKRIQESTFMTINEKRIMLGMDAIEGGDTLHIESGKIPLGMASMGLDETI